MFRHYLYLYYLGQNWDLTLPTSRVHLKDPHGPGDSVSILWKQEYTEYVLQCYVSGFTQDFQPALREITCPFLYLLLFPWSGDISGHCLVMFMKLHQTFVWKALLTVMPAWFTRWLQENGGGGRVPNIAGAFIFDIIKRSPGQGPDWNFLEYKMQMCAFMPGNACHACGQHFTSRTDTVARESIWVLVILYRVSCQFEVGQKKGELWSPPLPDLRDSGLLARPSAYE